MTEQPSGGVSRREFLAASGGAAGFVALAALGLSGLGASPEPNEPAVDPASARWIEHEADVLVVGGGMAAVFAAVKARDAGARVVVVSKGRIGASGQTPFAKGIFAYDPKTAPLGPDEFVAAVSRSALGTNNPVFTRQLVEHSRARVEELRAWGFFDAPLCAPALRQPLDARRIPVVERVMVTHLVRQGGRVVGAAGFAFDEPRLHLFRANAVVLCTGAGGFKPSGFPICDLTHDGTAMAYRVGAKVTGKEWNDGHFTRADHPAACYDGWRGMFDRKPGITQVEIHHDLGVEMNYRAYVLGGPLEGGSPGAKEASPLEGGPYQPEEFRRPGGPPPPSPGKGRRPKGPPPGMGGGALMGGASAGMSIHKSEGLAPTDPTGASTVPGLWAAGDALGSHMSGGIYTQIGSSLAGSAIQGALAGEAAARYGKGVPPPRIAAAERDRLGEEILAPLRRKRGFGPAWVTQTLQGIMIPNFVLYVKREPLLRAALAYVEELRDHHVPLLRAADLHELRLAHETANMVLNAEMKLRASLFRTESRCSHYRLDYPEMDTANWNAWVNLYRGPDGSMRVEKQPFGTWAAGQGA
ncbi:MAG: FAD-binding protein [Candidatus Dadabacteria bacterium]|nr:MAG: FAD-binding protein [Candidatus Dadabacteria bacterium]